MLEQGEADVQNQNEYKQDNARRNQCLTVQTGTRLQRVPLASIRYLESQGRKLVFHCQEGELTCYASLADRYGPRPAYVKEK